MDTIPVSVRDLILFAAFLIVRDGLPWIMRTVFPQWSRDRRHKEDAELKISKEIRERELALKQEIADRDKVIEERQTKAMENVALYTKALGEIMAGLTVQITTLNNKVDAIHEEQSRFFVEGRQAIRQVAVLSARKPPTKSRKN